MKVTMLITLLLSCVSCGSLGTLHVVKQVVDVAAESRKEPVIVETRNIVENRTVHEKVVHINIVDTKDLKKSEDVMGQKKVYFYPAPGSN